MAQKARQQFLDTKTGKLRFVHPDLATNKKFLSLRGLIIPPVPKAPPATKETKDKD